MNVLLIVNQEVGYRTFLIPSELLDSFNMDNLDDHILGDDHMNLDKKISEIYGFYDTKYDELKQLAKDGNKEAITKILDIQEMKHGCRQDGTVRKTSDDEEIVFSDPLKAELWDLLNILDTDFKKYENPSMPCTFDKLYWVSV